MYFCFIFPVLMGANSCKHSQTFTFKFYFEDETLLPKSIKESYFFSVFNKYFTENLEVVPLYLKCSSECCVFSISFMVFVLRRFGNLVSQVSSELHQGKEPDAEISVF